MSQLISVSTPEPRDHALDVVFVHGLGGTYKSTWKHLAARQSWPEMVAEDLPSCKVWSLDYAAGARGQGVMPLADRARSELRRFQAYDIGLAAPVVFVSHSAGGLIVKAILRAAQTSPIPEAQSLWSSTAGVVFLACPHVGTTLGRRLRPFKPLVSPFAANLMEDESWIADLHEWFIHAAEGAGKAFANYREGKKTSITGWTGWVVQRAEGNLVLSGVENVPLDGDHFDVAKPQDRRHDGYTYTRQFLEKILQSPVSIPSDLPKLASWEQSKFRFRGSSDDLPLSATAQSTEVTSHVAELATDPFTVILVGDVASGKSVLVSQVGRSLTENHSADCYVVPLGRDFSLREDWQLTDCLQAFYGVISNLPTAQLKRTIFIVEDIHESCLPLGRRWPFPEAHDLADLRLILTTRPAALGDLTQRLADNHRVVNPTVIRIDPRVTAQALISTAVPEADAARRVDFIRLYAQFGNSLVALSAAIDAWMGNLGKKDEGVSVQLAYNAVASEISRIASILTKGGDIGFERRVVALLWMFGGVDAAPKPSVLDGYFGTAISDTLLNRLEADHEIAITTERDGRVINVLRHPAWGHLTMTAVDESAELSALRTEILKRFREQCKARGLGKPVDVAGTSLKPSVCILFIALVERLRGDHDLAFYCSGRYLYDEYITASGMVLESELLDAEDPESRIRMSKLMLEKADHERRVFVENVDQWQDNLEAGYQLLQRGCEVRRKELGRNLEDDDERDWVYYTEAYYLYLLGRLEEAAELFQLSMDTARQVGGRRLLFAPMSGVMVGRVEIARRSFERAKKILDDVLDLQESRELAALGTDEAFRFRSNAYAALAEVALNSRAVDEASNYIKLHDVSAGRSTKLSASSELFQARLHLCRGEGAAAEERVVASLKDDLGMKSVERWLEANRVKGDAMILQGRRQQAIESYRLIVPQKRMCRFDEVVIAAERLSRLETLPAGRDLSSVLVGSPL